MGSLALLFSANMAVAQTTVPNGGFENWQNTGTSDEEPTNWSGNKTGGGVAGFGPQTCFREDTNPHSGTYCLKLENGSVFGTGVNASVTTGRIEAPSAQPSTGYIRTMRSNADFNSPFTGRPDSLVGWFRFDQGGSDIGRVQAILHGDYDVEVPDQGGSAPFVVATALFDVPNGNTSTWTRFSVPFTYNNGNTPDYILLIATASNTPGSASGSTVMWVDDLSVTYCTADTSVIQNGNTLTANATNATYQWVDCNNGNAPIAGATSASFTTFVTGSYAVEVTQGGCTAMSSCFNVVMSSTTQLDATTSISIAPNPTTGWLQLDLSELTTTADLRLLNLQGQVVQERQQANNSSISWDISQQPAGVYLLEVVANRQRTVLKVVKQ